MKIVLGIPPTPSVVELGRLQGGQCFRLVSNGAVYMRASGFDEFSRRYFHKSSEMKVAVKLDDGRMYGFPCIKKVIPVESVARVQAPPFGHGPDAEDTTRFD